MTSEKNDKPEEAKSASFDSGDQVSTKLQESKGDFETRFKFNETTQKEIRSLLQKDLNDAVQEVKKDFLVIFGLFASFVTFLSINVQVFRNSQSTFELIGICSVSLSFILFFALIVNDVGRSKAEWSDFAKPTYVICMIFLVVGIFFVFKGNGENIRVSSVEAQIKRDSVRLSEVNAHLQNIDSLKKDLKAVRLENSNLKFEIKKLQEKINALSVIKKKAQKSSK